jgi:hypothetical protein
MHYTIKIMSRVFALLPVAVIAFCFYILIYAHIQLLLKTILFLYPCPKKTSQLRMS